MNLLRRRWTFVKKNIPILIVSQPVIMERQAIIIILCYCVHRSDLRDDKTYFIREWGDNVDDWNAQNSDSRVARGWGEVPMLIQAEHYANPSYIKKYPILCYETICNKPKQIVGACFWHSFDHQRGYMLIPFYGGIMDAFRQPKTSYYMFMAATFSREK